jgi:hypothetical protein
MLTSTYKNNALKYSLQNIKQNKRMISVISILILVGFLLFTASLSYLFNIHKVINDDYSYSGSENAIHGIIIVGIACVAIGILLGLFVVPVQMFDYLLRKSKNDMIFALPIKKKHRFISDYITGLLITLIPTLILGIISATVISISAKIASSDSSSVFSIDFLDYYMSCSKFYSIIWKVLFLGILFVIFAYTIVVFVAQFSGSTIDCLAFSILILAIVPASMTVLIYSFITNMFNTTFDGIIFLMYGSSPVGNIIYIVENLDSQDRLFPLWSYLLTYLVFFAITLVTAYRMHLKRTAESVGKSIVFKSVYNTLFILSALCLTGVASIDNDFILPILFIALIAFILFVVFTNRGKLNFKSVVSDFGIYLFSAVASIFLFFVIDVTDSFGMDHYVPSASGVASVNVGISGDFDSTYTDKDDIKQFVDFNNEMKDNTYYSADYAEYIYSNCVTYTYKTKLGFTISKTGYTISPQDNRFDNFYNTLYQSDEYIESVASTYANIFKYHDYYSDVYGSNTVAVEVGNGDFYFASSDTYKFSKSEAETISNEIYEAAKKDFKNKSLEEHFSYNVYLSLDWTIVSDNNKNMIEVLKNHSITPASTENSIKDYFSNYSESSLSIIDPDDYIITDYGTYNYSEAYDDDWYYSNDTVVVSDSDFDSLNKLRYSLYGDYKSSESLENCNTLFLRENADFVSATSYSDTLAELIDYSKFYDYLYDPDDNYYMLTFDDYNATVYYIQKNEVTEKLFNSLKESA